MAKTQDLKRRIRSVRNTMQLTRAMKMVAAAKLRRSQERMQHARPYAWRMLQVLRSLSARTSSEEHALLQHHGDQRVDVVLVTADRGLCGAFNAGIIRLADSYLREQERAGREVTLNAVGKKGREYFASRRKIHQEWTDVFRQVEFSTAKEIAAELIRRYVEQEVDSIHLVYNEFKSAIQSKPLIQQLLPIQPDEISAGQTSEDYIYEPSARKIYRSLLPHYVENQVFQAMLESAAAEQASRMAAMDAATRNAGELIDNLTLTMNRVRQASITTEIIEVVSGAEALG